MSKSSTCSMTTFTIILSNCSTTYLGLIAGLRYLFPQTIFSTYSISNLHTYRPIELGWIRFYCHQTGGMISLFSFNFACTLYMNHLFMQWHVFDLFWLLLTSSKKHVFIQVNAHIPCYESALHSGKICESWGISRTNGDLPGTSMNRISSSLKILHGMIGHYWGGKRMM